jgi:hypothetical protein
MVEQIGGALKVVEAFAAAITATTAPLAIVHSHSCDRVVQLRAYLRQLCCEIRNSRSQFLNLPTDYEGKPRSREAPTFGRVALQ